MRFYPWRGARYISGDTLYYGPFNIVSDVT